MLSLRRLAGCGFLSLALCCSLTAAEVKLRVVGWNVESGDAEPDVIANRILNEDGVDIWGLSEVRNDTDAAAFEEAAEEDENADFKRIVGTTGGSDRLAIVYNSDRLTLVGNEELHNMNIGGNVRAPLVAHFRGKTTGKEFLFMVNHLYRGNASRRHDQATMLNQWVRTKTIPVVTVGDFNFDWHFQTGDVDHDTGYNNMVKDAAWVWVRPQTLVPTNSSPHNSVLDFVFVAGDSTGWQFKSTILTQQDDFPDGPSQSDHRPVDAVFVLQTDTPTPGHAPVGVDRDEIIRRIDDLQRQLDALRGLIGEDNNETETEMEE